MAFQTDFQNEVLSDRTTTMCAAAVADCWMRWLFRRCACLAAVAHGKAV